MELYSRHGLEVSHASNPSRVKNLCRKNGPYNIDIIMYCRILMLAYYCKLHFLNGLRHKQT